eukprot:1156737-Pelagomonas_calceolata.AAC.4
MLVQGESVCHTRLAHRLRPTIYPSFAKKQVQKKSTMSETCQHMVFLTVQYHMAFFTVHYHMVFLTVHYHMVFLTVHYHMVFFTVQYHMVFLTVQYHMVFLTVQYLLSIRPTQQPTFWRVARMRSAYGSSGSLLLAPPLSSPSLTLISPMLPYLQGATPSNLQEFGTNDSIKTRATLGQAWVLAAL